MLRTLLLAVGLALAPIAAAYAAGIDSRAYTCADLHSLIRAQGFVFISQPTFGDFVVASAYYCGGGDKIETRSVATRDQPECLVNYCNSFASGEGK